jgi:hypothetical protein
MCHSSVSRQAAARETEEVLRKALQHAAGFVDRHFLGAVQAAGTGTSTRSPFLRWMTSVRSARGVRAPITSKVSVPSMPSVRRFTRLELQRQHAHADQVGAVDALEAFGHDGFHAGQAHALGAQSRDEPWP